jgi:predicted DCC family thiol-disulfide oxidoreductase YuxK
MKRLYMLYDSRCGLCSRLRTWIETEPAYCEIVFVAAGSPWARTLFPQLRHEDEPSELVAISDEGDVYKNDEAWIVCLWALVDYRDWSYRLAHQPLRRAPRLGPHLLEPPRDLAHLVVEERRRAGHASRANGAPASAGV